jgi:hypothetical protein
MLPSQREVDKSTKPQRYAEKKIISQEDLQAFLGKILERFGGRTWARTKDPLIKSPYAYLEQGPPPSRFCTLSTAF